MIRQAALSLLLAPCHLHPPAMQAAPLSLPLSPDAAACEASNQLLYAGQGRCHCTAGQNPPGSAPTVPPPSVPGQDGRG